MEKRITTLMDVRTKPTAWCNAFTGRNLKKVFGMKYSFMGNLLGGEGQINEKDIEALSIIQTNERLLLLCAEKDPAKCHRHYEIAVRLLKYGIVVHHLVGDKEVMATDINEQGRLAV